MVFFSGIDLDLNLLFSGCFSLTVYFFGVFFPILACLFSGNALIFVIFLNGLFSTTPKPLLEDEMVREIVAETRDFVTV